MKKTLGGWAFIIGLILAIIIALFGINYTWPVYLLVFLGIIVGLLNITDKEVGSFLIASIAFMAAFTILSVMVAEIPAMSAMLAELFKLLNIFVAASAVVVAFKALFAQAKN